ncbi:MAG: type IV toxin-antitoxin system AbiEi family antitoxin domain-containing protein, partial [Bifidobacteriaceae bacterium]|nr:type IV toxin-antitoxin system AbiEi family antitoxin domain-containing protein [Bifidobacteriaceae bacterium]
MGAADFSYLLASQAGVFTRSQAVRSGIHSREITRAIRQGEWVRVAGRAFVISNCLIEAEQLAWAAVLSVSGAVVRADSALKLWRPDAPVPLPVIVQVATTTRHRAPVRIAPRKTVVLPDERGDYRGIPVQTVDAALVD